MADETIVERVERETESALEAVRNMNAGRNNQKSVEDARVFLTAARDQVNEWESKLATREQRLRAWEDEQLRGEQDKAGREAS
jgi:hypothetical protein